MKKILFIIIAMLVSVNSFAQFEEGKHYISASVTGLDLNYKGEGLNLGTSATAGYLPLDNLMLLASGSYEHSSNKDIEDVFSLGVSGRYYILQNGIYLGAGAKYVHASHYNDIMPGVEIGYAFFVNHHITLEPALYYDQSLKKHSDYSTIGLRVGFGFYF